MKILFLDTSSRFLSLAVSDDSRVLSQVHRLLDRKVSVKLVTLIERMLKKAHISLKEIDGFCVSKGPGSFTGLRIGITCVKGLAYVLGKPVVAIPSLDILAQNVEKIKKIVKDREDTLQVCPVVDARQNKVYACLYQFQDGIIKRKSDYLLLPIGELLKKIKGRTIFLGDAISIYREEILKVKNIKPIFAEEKLWYPKTAQAVSLAMKRFRQGKFDNVDSLTPLYLYPEECQVKRG